MHSILYLKCFIRQTHKLYIPENVVSVKYLLIFCLFVIEVVWLTRSNLKRPEYGTKRKVNGKMYIFTDLALRHLHSPLFTNSLFKVASGWFIIGQMTCTSCLNQWNHPTNGINNFQFCHFYKEKILWVSRFCSVVLLLWR